MWPGALRLPAADAILWQRRQEPQGDSGTALSQLRIQLYRDLSRRAAGRYLPPDGLRPLPEYALVVGPGLAGLTTI